MILGIPKETLAGERRVALVPESFQRLPGVSIRIEHEAGALSGIPDSAYVDKGASIEPDSGSLYGNADLILKVQPPTPAEASAMKEGAFLTSFLYPLANI